MASNLEQCVINALKTLGDVALNALKTVLNVLLVMLQEQLLALIAKATPLQIAKKALQAEAAIVKGVSDSIKNAANAIPMGDLEAPCISLSLINLNLADRLAPITDTLDELYNEVLVLVSLVDLNSLAMKATQELIDDLNEMIDAIGVILNERAAGRQPPL